MRRAKSAFSIIELLVTLAVILVVLGLAIPSLGLIRNRAIVARSLSGHQQVYSSAYAFGIDEQGQFPFPFIRREGTLSNPTYTVSNKAHDDYVPASMALQARIWVSLFVASNPGLVDVVYQGQWAPIVGRDVPPGLWGGSFVATSTMFATPPFFGIDTTQVNKSQLRPTRQSMVLYPSNKVLFEDMASWGRVPSSRTDVRSATFSFADGSAEALSQAELTGNYVMRALAWQTAPGHTTLNGLMGTDRVSE
ncbi:MAG: type II secretion system protein [Phycisphaerales bacterium]